MGRLLLGLVTLAVVVAVGVGAYFFRLTSDVEVARTPPSAATIALDPGPPARAATPTSAVADGPEATPTAAEGASPPPPTRAPAGQAGASATERPADPTAQPTPPPSQPARVYRIDSERSRAIYRARETFLEDQRVATAEGATNAVAGEILVDRANPARSRVGEIVVDISQFASDSERRDNAIRRQWLESAEYPRATFKNATLRRLPARVVEGRPFTFEMEGDMTLHATTRRQKWDVTATLEGDALRGETTTRLRMSEYGVEPPNIGGFVAVEDDVALVLRFVATAVR